MAFAVFALIVVTGLAIASFCAGWIAHEQTERCPQDDDDRTQPIPPTPPADLL